jgi:hypothetical protein
VILIDIDRPDLSIAKGETVPMKTPETGNAGPLAVRLYSDFV